MKKKATRHYAHVAHAMHHHTHKHLPKVFYHQGSLSAVIFWKSLVVLFICVFMGYFLFANLSPQTTVPSDVSQKMVFSFDGSAQDWGVNPDSLKTHGAASNEFDFLFQDTSSSVDTSVSSNQILVSTGGTPGGVSLSSNGSSILSDIGSSKDSSSIDSSLPVVVTDPCITPWGELVPNKDFVLAYQQRTDDNSLCNIQKRYCANGKLTGSYTQKSCKQGLPSGATSVETVLYNNDPVDPLIQPNQPRLSGAQFDSHGKINAVSQSTDSWYNAGNKPTSSTGPYVTNISTSTSTCTTPWGESLTDGHFVKAYKSSVGLKDLPCEVEIRYCYKGLLKGSLKQPACVYKDMTYSDYLLNKPEGSTKPNVIDTYNSVLSQSQKTNPSTLTTVWKWVTKYF